MHAPHLLRFVGPALAAAIVGGCGSSTHASSGAAAGAGGSAAGGSTTSAPAQPGALSADATSAATGDIPDNQVFLTFAARQAGFAMKYPEGWTQLGSGSAISFKDKNNLVRVLVQRGAAPTMSSVSAQLAALKRSSPTLTFTTPTPVTLGAGAAIRARYTTETAPNPVTGRRVKLIVDRYELAHAGRVAIVDLGTPAGVDNVDAYRKMILSFRWR